MYKFVYIKNIFIENILCIILNIDIEKSINIEVSFFFFFFYNNIHFIINYFNKNTNKY